MIEVQNKVQTNGQYTGWFHKCSQVSQLRWSKYTLTVYLFDTISGYIRLNLKTGDCLLPLSQQRHFFVIFPSESCSTSQIGQKQRSSLTSCSCILHDTKKKIAEKNMKFNANDAVHEGQVSWSRLPNWMKKKKSARHPLPIRAGGDKNLRLPESFDWGVYADCMSQILVVFLTRGKNGLYRILGQLCAFIFLPRVNNEQESTPCMSTEIQFALWSMGWRITNERNI